MMGKLDKAALGLAASINRSVNQTIQLTGGLDPRELLNWRDGVARMAMGMPGQYATLAVVADSRASGYMGGYVSTTNTLQSWPIQLAKRIARDTGIDCSYDAWWGATRYNGTVGENLDSRITNNGFSAHPTFRCAGGAMFQSTASNQTISFTTAQAVDTIDVVYYGLGDGQFTVSVDGGTTALKMTRVTTNKDGSVWFGDGRGDCPVRAAAFQATISGAVMTVTSMLAGTLAVGQEIRRIVVNTLTGTVSTEYGTIQSFGTGSGGVGTYNLSVSSTVSSAITMTAHAPQTTLTCNHGTGGGDSGTSLRRVRVMASGTTLGFPDANFSSGIKTITIKALTTGVIIAGVAAYNSAVPQIRVNPAPWVGSTTKDWANGTAGVTASPVMEWFKVMRPDLTIVDLTTNDMSNNLGQSSTYAGQALASGYLDTIVGTAGTSGARQYGDVLMVVPYDQSSGTVPSDQQVSWQDFVRNYAKAKGVPLFDMQNRMVSYASIGLAYGVKGQSPGWYADGTHMYAPGHQDYANGMARALSWI